MSAPTTEEVQQNTGLANAPEDENLDIPELGDIITVKSGSFGSLTGKIVYRDEQIIRIQRFTESDRATDIPMGDDGDYAEGTGITETVFHAKRTDPHFGVQLGASPGEMLEFYTLAGMKAAEPGIIAEILADDVTDVIVLTDGRRLNFAFIGPPLPIAVVEVRAPEEEAPAGDGTGAVAVAEGLPDEFDISALKGLLPASMVEDVPTAEQTYDESIQREDMFIDLMKEFNETKQKNPYLIRRISRETELLLALKNAVITTGPDGSVRPFIRSAANLEEVLNRLGSPLSSIVPVLAVKRILYHGKSTMDPPEAMLDQVEFRDWFKSEMRAYRNQAVYLAGQESGGAAQVAKLMYAYLYDVLFSEGSVFVPAGSAIEGEESLMDQDILRTVVPPEPALGYTKFDEKAVLNQQNVGPVKSRQHRVLGGMKTKDGDAIVPGDPGTVDSYLLLPTLLGSTYRPMKYSGALAEDIRAGLITSSLLPFENVTNNSAAYAENGIVVVKGAVATSSGDEANSILIPEFIERNLRLNVHPSDLMGPVSVGMNRVIDSIGMRSYEWTPEMAAVIWKSVAEAQRQYTVSYDEYVAAVEALKKKGGYVVQPLVADTPVFKKSLEVPEIAAVLAKLKESDLVKGSLDLAQAQQIVSMAEGTLLRVLYLSLSPQANPHLKRAREVYLAEGKRAILAFAEINGALAKYKAEPTINTCPHVKDKDALRSVMNRDESKFYALLQEFLKRYQGKRDSANHNWVMCNICDTHLICSHELMKFYELLHPGRADALHKEVILNFGGAAFNGRYVCRNCGIPISEFEYDTHLEYNDEGRPLVGRAVITDEEKSAEDELDGILNISFKKKTLEFENPIESELYEITRVIVQNTGFSFTEEEYRKTVDFAYNFVSTTIPPKEVYDAAPPPKRGIRAPYESFRASTEVACIATFIICHVHSTTPLPDVLFPFGGCRFQRGGAPIEPAVEGAEGGAVEYFVCVIANLNRATEPWNYLAWATESSPERRQNMVRDRLSKLFTQPEIRVELQKAQLNYLAIKKDTVGNASAGDRLPGSFRPSNSSKPPIMGEAAMTYPDRILAAVRTAALEEIGPVVHVRNRELAINSVINAHAGAKASGLISETSVRSESNCCFVSLVQAKREGLATFNEAAVEQEIGALRLAETIVHKRDPTEQTNGTHLYVRWTPPEAIRSTAVAPDASYFKLFMRTCFKGPREGLSHEFGRRANRYECRHCKFNLARDPLILASDLNDEEAESKRKGKAIVVVQEEARETLKANGVTVNAESFAALLAVVRKSRYVEPTSEQESLPATEIYARLEGFIHTASPLMASRMTDWLLVQKAMIANFARDAEPSEEARKITWAGFVSKYDALRTGLLDQIEGRQGRAPVRQVERKSAAVLEAVDQITSDPIHQGPAEINKHLVIGLERLAQGFSEMVFGEGKWFGQTIGARKSAITATFNGKKWFGKKISEKHATKFEAMIQTIMGANTDTNKELSAPKIRADSAELLHRLSTYLGRIVGLWSEQMVAFRVYGVSAEELQTLLRWIVLASVESLLLVDSPLYSKIAKDADKITIQRILLGWVRTTFLESGRQFKQFGMTDDEVQMAIEDAREKEKNSVIKEIDDEKDPDLQALIKINKGLKIGRWAVGSSKNLSSYNAEFYDFLQDQRDRAGIVDTSGRREDPLGFDFGAQPQEDARYDTYAGQDEDEGGAE
uniref:Uncharacterized protein n=1 Tax=viral metagenome TaxID=1070528 RepID=A0A6C0DT00_9ZZZZ